MLRLLHRIRSSCGVAGLPRDRRHLCLPGCKLVALVKLSLTRDRDAAQGSAQALTLLGICRRRRRHTYSARRACNFVQRQPWWIPAS